MKSLYEHQLSRDTIPGVYVQAQAVNDLLRREVPRSLTRAADGGILFGLCMIASLAATRLPLLMASILLSAEMLLWTAVAVVAFNIALLLPWLSGMLSALLAFCAMLSYRFTVNERDKRLLRRGFSLFLPAGQVEKLLADRKLPTLGGEAREVTIWFSDIAGFTALSENVPPEELVGLLNRYLGRVTELIEAEGGFVDKYLGDGVLAVFGAPRADPAHAARAVAAALATIAQPIEGLTTRIGLHSGRAVLGNVGSPRRFNYTVIGDAVNLAARLEQANKIYGTLLLTSESVANACPDPTVLREIDRVRVVGRNRPVAIFTSAAAGTVAVFADALAAYRRGDLSMAHKAFETLAPGDLVAAFFLERVRAFERNGLPGNWDGVTNLDHKG